MTFLVPSPLMLHPLMTRLTTSLVLLQLPAEDGVDDLFGVPASEPAEASPEAAPAGDSIDDLFGMPEENAAPTSSIDDLFGAAPAAPAMVVEESFEELPAPIVEPSQSVHVVSSEIPQVLSLADTQSSDVDRQLRSIPHRWTLDRNQRRTMFDLFKTNGRTCTVPNDRLCEADAAYVDSIRQQIETARIAMLTSK